MNMIGFWICAILAIIFGMLGIFFALAKEKGAKFVSGFNSFSKDEQALYDKKLISKDMRNQCFILKLARILSLQKCEMNCLNFY